MRRLALGFALGLVLSLLVKRPQVVTITYSVDGDPAELADFIKAAFREATLVEP